VSGDAPASASGAGFSGQIRPATRHVRPKNGVGGADGCRAGWVLAMLYPLHPDGPGETAVGGMETAGGRLVVEVVGRLDGAIGDVASGRLAALAVDMPMGLPDDGPRACDVAARRRLGPRRSSVFPTPVRATLDAPTYAEALARSRAASGRGLSRQAFNLLAKIAELDAVVRPELQDRVVEAHPEMAFARLAGGPCVHPKRSAAGRAERLALLHRAGLGDLSALRLPGAAPDDVLDAVALTLTAARVRDGTAERLGDGACDARGLRMEVVC
jgi:predicted RNase H-like nuclease